jgi:CDP-paratose 2-epimerase
MSRRGGVATGAYSLITGGAGFIGCNLADALLRDGESVVVADTLVRDGVENNARWLHERHGARVQLREVDVRDQRAIAPLVQGAATVYHLAAQVAVTTAVANPREDLEVNVLGTFNVLEAARTARRPPAVLFTSTNKVYGSLAHVPVQQDEAGYRLTNRPDGVDEREALDFHSPYGCSKGAADQYVRDYARIYGLPTVVFRMSCIYGEHQMGTEDQGWVAHFARCVLAGEPITLYGDGYQVRDVLWVGDLVRAMRAAVARAPSSPGDVFNLGGGPANQLSVRGAVERIMKLLGREVPVRSAPWRPGDQKIYVSNIARGWERLSWRPEVSVAEGLERLVDWMAADRLVAPRAARAAAPTHPPRRVAHGWAV